MARSQRPEGGGGRDRPVAWLTQRLAESLCAGDVIPERAEALMQVAELSEAKYSTTQQPVVGCEKVRNGESGQEK